MKWLIFVLSSAFLLSLMLIVPSVLASFDHSREHAGIPRFATALEVEWSRTFDGLDDDIGYRVQQAS